MLYVTPPYPKAPSVSFHNAAAHVTASCWCCTHVQMLRLLAALVAACALLDPASAGGYGKGKPHRLGLYSRDEWYFNHSPAPAANSLPQEFNWCNHEGTNYCTASWNQHIPRFVVERVKLMS